MDNPKNVNPGGGEILPCVEDEACDITSCAVCLVEVPASVAKSVEGPDYVHHFCGLDCLDKWQRRAQQEHAKADGA